MNDATTLTADDFARLATAAYLLGHKNDCVQALQRAYQANLDAGDMLAAVRCGFIPAGPARRGPGLFGIVVLFGYKNLAARRFRGNPYVYNPAGALTTRAPRTP